MSVSVGSLRDKDLRAGGFGHARSATDATRSERINRLFKIPLSKSKGKLSFVKLEQNAFVSFDDANSWELAQKDAAVAGPEDQR